MRSFGKFLFMATAIILIAGLRSEAQKPGNESGTKAALVKKCDTLFYFGVDISHVRVTDGPKISKSQKYSTVYPSAWIKFIEAELPPYDYIQDVLKKRVLRYLPDEIENRNMFVVPGFIISTNYSFEADSLSRIVKEYTLQPKAGIGLVIIPENFNKNFERATCWITFFDLQSREILWAVRSSGDCSHMGYTAHWGTGAVNAFRNFILNVWR